MNRKIGVVILALVAVLSLSLFACDTAKPALTKAEALQNYIFTLEDSVVKDDFTLQRRIGDYRATWTSDSEYVVLEKRTNDYLAKVTIPEEDVEVHLTVDLRGASDTYTIRLQAITAQDFVDSFSFAQNRGTVYADFELASETTYKGRTATIDWTVKDESYIKVEGNKCVVNPSSLNPTVTIYATFTYKGESITTFYTFTVSETMEPLQEVNYWYNNTGVSITMKGYVVAIATEYSASYGNVSLYMIDENLHAGYYLYRAKVDAANAANLKPGVYVTFEESTNQDYNGLMETNAGGKLTVDATKTIDLSTTYYAIDNDIIADAPAARYNQSRLVTLTNWTVSKVSTTVTEKKTQTLFQLTKGGKTVSVAVSSYFEGVYTAASSDATYAAILAKYKTINEGDVVSVKGLMSWYNGAQIIPYSADDIVVGGTVGENDTVAATAVANAIKATDKTFDLDAVITKETEVTLPEAIEGVTTTYRLLGTRTAFSIVDGKLVIVPGAAEIATVQVTFEFQGYTANKFYTMRAEDLDNQGKADWEIENLDVLESVAKAGNYDLPDVKFFKAEADGAAKVVWTTDAPYATIKGTVLTLAGLPLEADTMKVTATVTVGEATSTRDYFIDVAAYDATTLTYAEAAPEAGTYAALAIEQKNLSKTIYATAEMEGYYVATTSDITKAAQITLTVVEEGKYTVQIGGKYLEVAVVMGDDNKTHNNIKLYDTATEGFVWTWNTQYNTFQTVVESDTFYAGTYDTKQTLSVSLFSYITTSFPSKLVTGTTTATAQDILDSIKVESTVTEDFALDYKASWEVIDGTGIEIDGLTAKVTQGTTAQTVTLEATLTYGGETVTKEFTITIPVLNPAPADGEYVYGLYQAKAEKQLYIDSSLTISSGSFQTTEDPLKAAKVTLTTVEGGYKITIGGKVLEVGAVGTYYNPVLLEESTGTLWVWDNLLGIMTFKAADGNNYYLGAFSTQNDNGSWYNRTKVSASKVSYINSTNKGVTQFPCTFQRPAPLAGEYIYGVYQGGKQQQYYISNELAASRGWVTTTTDVTKAAKFTLTTVEGGYQIASGTKVLEVVKSGTYYNLSFVEKTSASSTPWVWNDKAGVMTFTIDGKTYYVGNYGTSTDVKASLVSYIDDLSVIGKSQYVAKFEYAPVTTGGETGGNTEGEGGTTATTKFDFVNGADISDFSKWGNSYAAHGPYTKGNVSVSFSRASNQSDTTSNVGIKDRPVLATGKGVVDAYVTLSLGTTKANAVTFNLKQWGTKTFTSIVIEISADGETWTSVTTDGTLSGACAYKATFTASQYVRLHVYNSGSSGSSAANVQLGISSITWTFAE